MIQFVQRKLATLLLFVIVLTSPIFASTSEDKSSDYILLINSYVGTNVWSNQFITPIYEDPLIHQLGLSIYTEHLNTQMITGESDVVDFENHLFEKYQTPPRLIILFENNAFVLLNSVIEEKWGKDIPILLFTQKDYLAARENYLQKKAADYADRIPLQSVIKQQSNLTVIYVPIYIRETVTLMKKMIPEMNRIAFISDQRYISAQNRQDLIDVIHDDFPDISYDFYTTEDISTDSLILKLKTADNQTAILFFAWNQRELHAGNIILETNTYRLLSSYISAPIFSLNDIGINENGMIGGYFNRISDITSTFTGTLNDLLNKKNYSNIIYPPSPLPIFNYLALDRHQIELSSCPPNSFLYMKPISFWDKNKTYIVGGFILICILALLLRTFTLQRKQEAQERELNLMAIYSDLVNNMPIAYQQEKMIFDKNGELVDYVVTRINSGFESQLNPKEAILGKKGTESNKEMVSELLKLYKMILEDKSKKVNIPYYHQETDRYFSIIITASSTPNCMDLFFVDTTELFKTQQLLRTVNNKLTMSLDIANITPWKWDLENKLILCDVNKPLDIFSEEGIRSEEQLSIPEKEYLQRIHKDDRERVKRAYARLINGKVDKIKEEYRILSQDTSTKRMYEWIEAQAAVEKRDENGKVISLIGSSVTITERKKIEHELLNAKEKAEESNRLKSAFLANMSHEIRTPLNAIVGFSSVLVSTDNDEDKQEYVNIIENNSSLLLQLISDILDLSKLEAGTMEFHYSDTDLNVLLKEQEEITQKKANAGVSVVFEKQLPDGNVCIEKNRLLQVLGNMLINATKFTTEGSIRFGYRQLNKSKLQFYVTDTGCGISKDQVDKIFGRFVKLNSFMQGTGLGLSICQTVVQHLGGDIGVKSDEGKGSTFWFTFPFTAIQKTGSLPIESQEPEAEPEKMKVLIAEDIPSNFELLEFMLKRDYEIIHAWDGVEAVELFKEHQPNIVLMDINMPKMNGYEATVEIRKLSDSVPIIAVTAYAFSSDEQHIKDNGFNAYSAKPLNARSLRSQISELLNQANLL